MRRMASVLVLSALALAGCQKKAATNAEAPATKAEAPEAGQTAAAVAPSAPEVPNLKRKAGLWEMKMSSEGVAQATSVCVDPSTDEKLGITGQRRGANPCREHKVAKTADGYAIDSVCELGDAGTMTSHGVMTGDPGSHYKVEMTTTTSGAKAAQMNGTRKSVMEATWKGPCPADMKPGDVEVGGVKFNAASGG